ncbi:MAG: sulfurtransferase TusA family protein [Desulfobulbus sp.]|jgi:TusA-related sulfurtransferase
MNTTVDARGLSCPQPVLDTLKQLKAQRQGEILVLVDTEASKENVIRAASAQHWQTERVEQREGAFHILLRKD